MRKKKNVLCYQNRNRLRWHNCGFLALIMYCPNAYFGPSTMCTLPVALMTKQAGGRISDKVSGKHVRNARMVWVALMTIFLANMYSSFLLVYFYNRKTICIQVSVLSHDKLAALCSDYLGQCTYCVHCISLYSYPVITHQHLQSLPSWLWHMISTHAWPLISHLLCFVIIWTFLD